MIFSVAAVSRRRKLLQNLGYLSAIHRINDCHRKPSEDMAVAKLVAHSQIA